jgi:hypothetical protein
MTVISDDPSQWSLIYLYNFHSYFIGSWRVGRLTSMISWANLGCGFIVAATAAIIYDWGKQDSKESLIS